MNEFVEMSSNELEETQGGIWVAIAFGFGLGIGLGLGYGDGRNSCE